MQKSQKLIQMTIRKLIQEKMEEELTTLISELQSLIKILKPI